MISTLRKIWGLFPANHKIAIDGNEQIEYNAKRKA